MHIFVRWNCRIDVIRDFTIQLLNVIRLPSNYGVFRVYIEGTQTDYDMLINSIAFSDLKSCVILADNSTIRDVLIDGISNELTVVNQ